MLSQSQRDATPGQRCFEQEARLRVQLSEDELCAASEELSEELSEQLLEEELCAAVRGGAHSDALWLHHWASLQFLSDLGVLREVVNHEHAP